MPDRFLEEDSAELLSRLRFSQLSLTDRLAVLSEIAARNDVQGISDYLVQELEKANLPLEWLVGLLTAAEEVTHSDETLCRLLSDQLLQRVQELRVRRSEDPVLAETAIAAAFRTFGLIAPLDQADRLAAFIDPADSSISQKTFIAIRALFSAQGPESQLAPLELSAKVGDYLKRGFAEKPLSASRFGHLTTGVLAAVALGEADRQVVPVLPQLLDWQKEFLSRRLGEIRQDWQATKTGADPERLAQLQACLKILDSNLVGKS